MAGSGYQAKCDNEMQAVADSLSLSNILMTWNTTKMQAGLDHRAQRRGGAVPSELIGRVAPTRTEGISLPGVFRFLVECDADKILPIVGAGRTMASTL